MTRKNAASFPQEVKDLFTQNKDMLKELLQESVQEILEARMSELPHAECYERTGAGAATAPAITPGSSTPAWG